MKIAILLVVIFAAYVLAGNPHCTSTSWKACIGSTGHCNPCYDDNPGSANTVDKAVVLEYNRILVERTYADAYLIFAPNIVVNVPYDGISFAGADLNVNYLYLGDPTVSDTYVILSSTIGTLLQEENVVFARLAITYQNLHSNVIWSSTNLWVFTFSANHTIVQEDIYVDTVGTSTNLYSEGTLNTDIPSLCASIFADCTGTLQPYASLSACQTFMAGLEVERFGQVANGNTVSCRSWHEVLARKDPSVHCEHTGPLKIDPVNTPCNDF
jgi:hypothetical protein